MTLVHHQLRSHLLKSRDCFPMDKGHNDISANTPDDVVSIRSARRCHKGSHWSVYRLHFPPAMSIFTTEKYLLCNILKSYRQKQGFFIILPSQKCFSSLEQHQIYRVVFLNVPPNFQYRHEKQWAANQ